jgi:DNA (cytosine-5)-methyltransferase 1
MTSNCHVFSFFSGLGFLDLGFEDEDFNIAFVNEFHPPFLEGYKYSRRVLGKKEPCYGYHQGSIETAIINEHISKSKEEGRMIGFIGGPPCPDFSIAGKQRGELGSNGRLTQIYIDTIIREKPDWFLFENVKGLKGTKKHKIFYDKINEQLKSEGYELSDRLVNSISYGVAQDRDRIIMIGFLNKTKIDDKDWEKQFLHPEDILDEEFWPKETTFGETPKKPRKVPDNLTVKYWFDKNDVLNHPNAGHHFKPQAGLIRFQTLSEGDDSKKSYKRLHRFRYSPTAAYGNNEVHLHPWLPRRISASEALAIQSIPIKYSLPSEMTLTNMFKGIGNGVPYLMARSLAKMISTKLK